MINGLLNSDSTTENFFKTLVKRWIKVALIFFTNYIFQFVLNFCVKLVLIIYLDDKMYKISLSNS